MSCMSARYHFFFFFFNDTATTEIYTLSLHDALPISPVDDGRGRTRRRFLRRAARPGLGDLPYPDRRPAGLHIHDADDRSEEHTSELQSQSNLVCRLLLEKKKDAQHQRTR